VAENSSPKHIVIDARIRRTSTGRYVDRLIEHLQDVDRLNRYTVLVQPDDPWKPRASNFTVVTSPFAQFSFNPLQQINFARQLYRLKADLVHFPMNQQPLLYFKPVVTTTMDTTMLHFTRPGRAPLPVFWLKMLGYRFLYWSSNRKSKQVITISNFVKNELAAKYRFMKSKTTTTYCASEPPLKGKAEPPKGVVKKDKFLLAVGTAFPHKNLTALVDAHIILAKKYPELKLFFAGKKEYYYGLLDSYIEQKANTGKVRTLGFVSDAELKWLYEQCAVYCFPTLSEGFGLPPLEAMVHGAPVAASTASCVPEVLGSAAHYFDPRSPADIAAKIAEILDNPRLRESLIKKGHEQTKKYSWRRMAEETLAVYKRALS
jgi:glycosyltransferase involved in cell wall biosynthesis